MKITSLFTKGLLVTAIATTMVLGSGVAGASASDGHHDGKGSGSEHEHDSGHGRDDDDDTHEEGHDGCDDDSKSSSPSTTTPVVAEPASEVPVDSTLAGPDTSTPDTTVASFVTPADALEIPVVAAPTVLRVASPTVILVTDRTANPQSQSVVVVPEAIREVTAAPAGDTSEVAPEMSSTESATAPSTSGNLPMTGASSLFVVGLAASLLAAGWLVIAGRRRKVVA
jgi:LPXTG-motif cell wall-anchored protein